MKSILYSLTLGFIVILSSCNTGDETSNREVEIGADTLAVADSLPTYSESLKNLMKTDSGTFRGVYLGMSAAEVKQKEDTAVVEETKDHLDYSINYFGELESADIRYMLDPNALVSGIEVFIYPKSKESQDSVFTEFKTYFTNKYGSAATPNTNSLKWENSEKNLVILMEKKDTEKVHDIKIAFTALTKQSASAQ